MVEELEGQELESYLILKDTELERKKREAELQEEIENRKNAAYTKLAVLGLSVDELKALGL